MTKFLTADELIARLGDAEADQLLGIGMRNSRRLDAELAEAELASVDAVIDGYIRARYRRGFKIIPAVLKGASFDIVRYRLRGKGGQSSDMAEVVKARYDEAMTLLDKIAKGIVTLDTDGDDEQPEGKTHATNIFAHIPPAKMPKALKGYNDL